MRRNILITTTPKAGTHLLLPLLERITQRPITRPPPFQDAKRDPLALDALSKVVESYDYRDFLFFGGHWRFGGRHPTVGAAPRWLTLVLIRDPRDVVLSRLDHILKSQKPAHVAAAQSIAHLSRREQIKLSTGGLAGALEPIKKHCSGFIEWKEIGAHVLRYEDIISGRLNKNLATMLDSTPEKVGEAIAGLVGANTLTLNVGRAERWRTEMDPELQAWFRENDGGAVSYLGYSWDGSSTMTALPGTSPPSARAPTPHFRQVS